MGIKKATFGAGCFWKPQEVYDDVDGVVSTMVGYMGGDVQDPSYEQVCRDDTGHIEVIEIQFEDSKISYEELLKIFFEIHNPTTKDRQGPDIGTQYKSSIFYHDDEQKKIAEDMIENLNMSKKFGDPIVTLISKAEKFYPAEDYHQKYYKKN